MATWVFEAYVGKSICWIVYSSGYMSSFWLHGFFARIYRNQTPLCWLHEIHLATWTFRTCILEWNASDDWSLVLATWDQCGYMVKIVRRIIQKSSKVVSWVCHGVWRVAGGQFWHTHTPTKIKLEGGGQLCHTQEPTKSEASFLKGGWGQFWHTHVPTKSKLGGKWDNCDIHMHPLNPKHLYI